MTQFQSNSKIYNVLRSVGVATPDTVTMYTEPRTQDVVFFIKQFKNQNIMVKNIEKNGNAVLTANDDRVLETLLTIFQKSVELQTEINTIEDCLTPQMRDMLEDALTDTRNASATLVSNTQFIVGSYLSEVIALAHAKKIIKEFPIREETTNDTDTVTIPKQEYDEMQRKIGAMEFEESKTE